LNHAPGDAINPQRLIAADANTLFCFRFQGIAYMAEPTAGLVPVANDASGHRPTSYAAAAKMVLAKVLLNCYDALS
jgi:hypothetical protein